MKQGAVRQRPPAAGAAEAASSCRCSPRADRSAPPPSPEGDRGGPSAEPSGAAFTASRPDAGESSARRWDGPGREGGGTRCPRDRRGKVPERGGRRSSPPAGRRGCAVRVAGPSNSPWRSRRVSSQRAEAAGAAPAAAPRPLAPLAAAQRAGCAGPGAGPSAPGHPKGEAAAAEGRGWGNGGHLPRSGHLLGRLLLRGTEAPCASLGPSLRVSGWERGLLAPSMDGRCGGAGFTESPAWRRSRAWAWAGAPAAPRGEGEPVPRSFPPAAESLAAARVCYRDKRSRSEVTARSTTAAAAALASVEQGRRLALPGADLLVRCLYLASRQWGYWTQEGCVFLRGMCLCVCFNNLFCLDGETAMYELEIGLHLLAKPQD